MIVQQIATAFHPEGVQSLILLTPAGAVYEMIYSDGSWGRPHLLNTEIK
jgi:hypothetical protein